MRTGVGTALAALVLSAGSALAAPVYVGETTFTDSFGTLGGGEFLGTKASLTINPASLGEVAGSFETFCMEEFEDTAFNVVLKADSNDRTVASLGNANYAGGMHGGFQDPLSNQTAWLYKSFITKTLVGTDAVAYDYAGAGRVNDANALQIAIWAFEDERPVPAGGTRARAFYDAATNAVTGGYLNDGVVVLNMYTIQPGGDRQEKQDVLAYVVVPLPTSAAAGLAMLGGLGFIRRRRA